LASRRIIAISKYFPEKPPLQEVLRVMGDRSRSFTPRASHVEVLRICRPRCAHLGHPRQLQRFLNADIVIIAEFDTARSSINLQVIGHLVLCLKWSKPSSNFAFNICGLDGVCRCRPQDTDAAFAAVSDSLILAVRMRNELLCEPSDLTLSRAASFKGIVTVIEIGVR
jgi:hypothetical protein